MKGEITKRNRASGWRTEVVGQAMQEEAQRSWESLFLLSRFPLHNRIGGKKRAFLAASEVSI